MIEVNTGRTDRSQIHPSYRNVLPASPGIGYCVSKKKTGGMDASDVIGAVAPVRKSWRGFNPGQWQSEIDVRGFIVANATPYCGGPDSLAPL